MLQTFEARRLEFVLEKGRTRPLVIQCRRKPLAPDEGQDNDRVSKKPFLMVVKAIGLPEVNEINLFCEVVGNVLAREMGVNTPNPALVYLTPEFVKML